MILLRMGIRVLCLTSIAVLALSLGFLNWVAVYEQGRWYVLVSSLAGMAIGHVAKKRYVRPMLARHRQNAH